MGNDSTGLVMDFFAGSGSTVEAILSLNSKDGGKRQIIAVQLPEATQPNSAAYKAGFSAIFDVSRERIKRLKAINEGQNGNSRGSWIPFLCACPVTFRQWGGDSIEDEKTRADQIQMFIKANKEGASSEEILFELLLKFAGDLQQDKQPPFSRMYREQRMAETTLNVVTAVGPHS
jgi:adenine-specific DNA-methyltransferase